MESSPNALVVYRRNVFTAFTILVQVRRMDSMNRGGQFGTLMSNLALSVPRQVETSSNKMSVVALRRHRSQIQGSLVRVPKTQNHRTCKFPIVCEFSVPKGVTHVAFRTWSVSFRIKSFAAT